MQTVAQELESRTQEYWRISSSYNNRIEEPIPTWLAIQRVTHMAEAMNPARPISRRASVLLHTLIVQNHSQQVRPATIHRL